MAIDHKSNNEHWDTVISSEGGNLKFDIKELWQYRELIALLVKRDNTTFYKQTILGPVWFILQPLLTTIIFVLLFGRIAGLSPNGVPKFAFYLVGINLWGYFSETLNITSKTFTDYAHIFGKVYFPRLIIPISKTISGFIKFLFQFLFFFIFWCYYVFVTKQITPNWTILIAPFILLVLVFLALGLGILITSLTTKYRDIAFLVTFGVQLLMYATPVAYSLSLPKLKNVEKFLLLNPLSSLFESFKYGFLGTGEFDIRWLLYSLVVSIFVFCIGLISFNKVEKKFIDTV